MAYLGFFLLQMLFTLLMLLCSKGLIRIQIMVFWMTLQHSSVQKINHYPLCDEQLNDNYLLSEQRNVNAYGKQASDNISPFSTLYSLAQSIYLFSLILVFLLSIIGLPRECNGVAVH